MNLYAKLIITMILMTGVHASKKNQHEYPACPINYVKQALCCDVGDGTLIYLRNFGRPDGNAVIADHYQLGWNRPRKVNIKDTKFPSTPAFSYSDLSHFCMIERRAGAEEVVCRDHSRDIVSPVESDEFWTYKGNRGNNNAVAHCQNVGGTLFQVDNEAQCVSDTVEIPALVDHYLQWPFLILYAIFLIFFTLVGLWHVYKKSYIGQEELMSKSVCCKLEEGADTKTVPLNRASRYGPSTPDCSSAASTESTISKSTNATTPEVEAKTQVVQLGYEDHWFGQFLMSFYCGLTLLWNVLIMVVILDKYEVFSQHVFKAGENSTIAFILCWMGCCIWLCFFIYSYKSVNNFFRLPVPLSRAQYVYMFKPDSNVEVMLIDRSGISQWVQRIETLVFGKQTGGYETTVEVCSEKGPRRASTSTIIHSLEFQQIRHVYDHVSKTFIPGAVDLAKTYVDMMKTESNGLTVREAERREATVGRNTIHIPMPSLVQSISMECFTLFYIYQLMSYYCWFYLNYYYMGLIMIIVICFTTVVNIWNKRRMQSSVRSMAESDHGYVSILRDGEWTQHQSHALVPGDVIQVQQQWQVPCDLVLIKGSTVCDESMLTGESMPVQKFAIPHHIESSTKTMKSGATTATSAKKHHHARPHEIYRPDGPGKKHTLFAGTKILQSGNPNDDIFAIVQTTGAHTSKGKLIRHILFPLKMKFKFDEHLKVIILILAVMGIMGGSVIIECIVTNPDLSNSYAAFNYFILFMSCLLSPVLPVMLTIGQVNASKRLEKRDVFCLDPKRIVLSGKVRTFCFDKTGTLTKEGLDFLGCHVVNPTTLVFDEPTDHEALPKLLQFALATCHALSYVGQDIVGNQVETKMFQSTKWNMMQQQDQLEDESLRIVSPHDPNVYCEILKRFEFDHQRMSMSVIVRIPDGRVFVFCKGSYEKLASISTPESIPENYSEHANLLASNGCYVLGMGYKELEEVDLDDIDEFSRDEVEEDLHLCSLLLFRNELKEDSAAAIEELKAGDVRCVMITGDNARCGYYIARKSKMITEDTRVLLADMSIVKPGDARMLKWTDVNTRQEYSTEEVQELLCIKKIKHTELAVTGSAFDHLIMTEKLHSIFFHIRIFSRMTPDGKVQCVKKYMREGVVTGMCGDGGNDCGALREAHVGIALSDAEASLVSPFTSKSRTIMSVVDLCREGRCSIATSFACIKMIIMYGLIGSTLRLFQYSSGVILSEWCFVLVDFFILVLVSYAITLASPLPTLGFQRPTSSLLGPTTLGSLLGQEVLNLIFIFAGHVFLTTQPWYCPFSADSVDVAQWWKLSDNALATCLFFTIGPQMLTSAMVFSFGSRYRQPIWYNPTLCVMLVVLYALCFYLIFASEGVLLDIFRIASSTNVVTLPDIPLPLEFRQQYAAIVVANIVASWSFEYFCIQGCVRDWFRQKFHKDPLTYAL